MALLGSQVQTVGQICAIRDGEILDHLQISLLVKSARASLELHNLTPLGPPRVGVQPIDEFVLAVWELNGRDEGQLGDSVLVMVFDCVPKGSLN